MAQIIKHRRGSIDSLAGATAKKGELVMATGSIENMNGPWIFVGETEGSAGAFRTLSKIYQGSNAPDLTGGTWGSTLNGTPFYGSTSQTLYILSNAGNVAMDLTGNIEGNVISGVTINNLTGSTGVFDTFVSASALNVSGNTTFNGSVKVTGLTDNRLVLVGTDGLLEDSPNLTFDGNTFNIGQGQFEVDNNTGNIRTSGSIVMKGNITIGDNITGDTINLNAEISSSLIPSGSGLFNLGSSGNTWGSIYVGTVNADNINLGSVSFTGLTQDRVVFVGENGSLVDNSGFTFAYDGALNDNVLEAPIIRASNDGNGTNFLIGNDMWLGDINEGNATRFMGNEDNNYAKIYLNASSTNNYLDSQYGDVTLSANNTLDLKSVNSEVNINAYDGNLNLNTNSNSNISIGGHTYIQNHNLYVDTIWDYSNSNNYLQLHGYGTDDGYWWESGNGSDTTLLNWENQNNINIVQMNNGNVNIDALGGSVNLHSNNGFNVTGSMVVSDGSGVFNSSLIASNSNLTLDNGSNLEMTQGHIYFNNGCGDIYYNTGNNDLTFYNDCGNLRLSNNTYINDDFYIENGNNLYTNYVYGWDDGDLNLGAWSNVYIYSENSRNIELRSDNAESGTNYLWVQNDGVGLQTYDFASGLNHRVYLDNTGSLNLTNVALKLSGSLNVNGNSTFDNDLVVKGDMYVSGNFTVLGTGSIITLSGSQVDIGTNKIILNTYAPFERFAGIDVYDSGSNVGVTGSLLWDSQNNVWIYANPSGSSYASARFISGPKNTGSLGEETGLTIGHFPIAVDDDHIADSLLTYDGTTLAFNTNKFTVDSTSGDTVILGNFTIHGVGGTDTGEASSYVVFRNDNDEIGFVNSNDTQNVLDQLLGYNTSTGVLEFSSVIDGGSY